MDLDQDIQVINQKRQKSEHRGKAQMENSRNSTSSQRLASTFDTLLESPTAYITAIAVSRPESFLTGSSGDIPVSVQKLVYGGKEAGKFLGPEKDRGPSEGLESHVFQRTSHQDKGFAEKQKHFFRGPEEKVGQKEGQQPIGSSSNLLNKLQKGKGKVQVKQTLPTELQNSKERKDSHGKCVQYGKNSYGIQKQ
ncbi:hypothetical protein O181_128392 [Austropuccinia psidii MF-1]|uniref:Uncharacterized protein n=1 Tax=Austropuccinia psidii MF-1 TaxID=1389203 RepID=A0A9Q3KZR9_9BASI|nr:hypothetical protein [Austropuccinia psidii MF-1]